MTSVEQLTDVPNIEVAQQLPQARSIGAVVLSDTIAAFHGGNEQFIGSYVGHRGAVSFLRTDAGIEVIGKGDTAEAAIAQTLEAMHHLETVKTKANVYMPMADGQQVLFTGIEHYSPKIAPGSPAYEVPEYLSSLASTSEALLDDKDAATLKNTLESPQWDKQLFALTGRFLDTPTGIEIAGNLGIKSLDALTPEQAVKLSVLFVQSVSKYSYKDGVPNGDRADTSTVMDLLSDGLDHKDDPRWEGNGVCRNIASSVKSVFDALKQNQTQLSMLQNTYVAYSRGMKDDGSYIKNRIDDSNNSTYSIHNNGHAWNTFITLDESGSTNITIVDATWALEHDGASAIQHMDYTTIRMAGLARELATKSDNKEKAFGALSDYYTQLIKETAVRYGPTSTKLKDTKEFVFTEYMKFVARNPSLIVEELVSFLPPEIPATADLLKDRLNQDELVTLHKMSKAEWIDNIDIIIDNYLRVYSTETRLSDHKIERLIVQDPELQEVLLQKIGIEKAVAMSEQSGRFRVRLRQTHPEWLPKFDPTTNNADSKELKELAQFAGFHQDSGNPEGLFKRVRSRIIELALNDEVSDAIMVGRTDYDLLKNYQSIRKALSNIQKQ